MHMKTPQGGGGHVVTEAKTEVMRLSAEGHQGRLATREAGRSKEGPPSTGLRGSTALPTPVVQTRSSRNRDNKSL